METSYMERQQLTLTDDQVLLSEAYRHYLQRVVRTVSGRYDLEVHFANDVQTDGRLIQVNPLSPWLSPLPTLEQKTLAILGQMVHEFFHIEYTDFQAYLLQTAKSRKWSDFRRQAAYRLFNLIEDGAIERLGCRHYVGLFRRALHFANHVAFSQMPSIQTMQQKEAPGFQVLSQASLMYVIMDRVKGNWLDLKLQQTFDQAKTILNRGKTADHSMGRLHCGEELFALFEPWIAEMEADGQTADNTFQYVKNEHAPGAIEVEMPGVESMSASALSQLPPPEEFLSEEESGNTSLENRSGQNRQDNEGLTWDDEVGHPADSGQLKPKWDRSPEEKRATLAQRLIKWFRFGKREHPQGQESQNVGDIESFRAGGDAGVEGDSPSTRAESITGPVERDSNTADRTETDGDAMDRLVEEVLLQLEQTMEDVRLGALQELRQNARNKERMSVLAQQSRRLTTGIHRGIQMNIEHRFTLTPQDEDLYLELAGEIRPLEQSMVRHWEAFLHADGGMRESGLYNGKWDDRRLWRGDARVFYRRTERGDSPALAILVLVDESHSMEEQERWKHAIRACLLLERVCHGSGIPFAVMGQMAVYGSPQVVHHHYIDFASRHAERRNLALIKPRENTREGLSLRYAGMYLQQACEKGLLGDPDKVKPMILVIADGEPTHDVENFTLKGEEAQADTREAVRKLEQQGIGVIGVAIGDGPSSISRIYSRCVEVRRLDMLPQRLLRQVMHAMGWQV